MTEKSLKLCNTCPKLCRYSCPVAEADQDERTTPWGKMNTMKMVEEKILPMTLENMGMAYKCTNCRASQSACELDNPVSETLDAYRRRAFQEGLTPGGISEYCQKFGDHNNPYGKDLLRVLEKNFPQKIQEPVKRAAYFPGCTEIAKNPESVEKTFALLHDLKDDSLGLYREPIQCCGYPLYAAGDWDNFVELADVNSNALNQYSLIVSGAPACLYTMQTLYREAGYPVRTRFLHTAEYLEKRLLKSALHLPRRPSVPVTYHDPCYLGRYRNTYEAPRRLIEQVSGKPPLEFIRNREASACCGAGGLLPVSFPETAQKITGSRLEEFRKTGGKILVTGCPMCVHQFKKQDSEIVVKNLVEYLRDGKS